MCLEPMHGACAGFRSERQIQLLTRPQVKPTTASIDKDSDQNEDFDDDCDDDDYADEDDEQEPIRLCDATRCPSCVAVRCATSPIHSRATLIVTPPSLTQQWIREIKRHTNIVHSESPSSPLLTEVVNDDGKEEKKDDETMKEVQDRSQYSPHSLKVVVYPGIRELRPNQSPRSTTRRRREKGGKGNVNQDSPSHKKDDIESESFSSLINPHTLSDADIVLVTFQTLMNELAHCQENNPFAAASSRCLVTGLSSSSTTLRRKKLYRVVPTPLTSIRWWRICLDEAQRIETPTASAAQMALKLQSEHRWCVSGTPMGKGNLDDLYGLLLFLGVKPFSDKRWFRHVIQQQKFPMEMITGNDSDGANENGDNTRTLKRIGHLLHNIMWRSTKQNASVRNQMGIPEQIEKKSLLQFSSIERHFYERQKEETILAAHQATTRRNKKNGNGKKMRQKNRGADKTVVGALSNELHRLRAACCHPQVGSRGIIGVAVGGRKKKMRHGATTNNTNDDNSSGILTMDQILDRLIDDARVKCEESQRTAMMHTNALASLDRVKVDARNHGLLPSTDDDGDNRALLLRSGRAYMEALKIADANAEPSGVVGEATLSGCTGFRSPRKIVRDGAAALDWVIRRFGEEENDDDEEDEIALQELWSRLDFEGPAKNVNAIRVRPILYPSLSPQEGASFRVLCPKDCILQVSNMSVGGEFVDVLEFTIPSPNDRGRDDDDDGWGSFGGFRTNKSKSWRVLIKTYHCDDQIGLRESSSSSSAVGKKEFKGTSSHCSNGTNLYCGLEVQLMEPDIAFDNLQRLHILHNASAVMSTLSEKHLKEKEKKMDRMQSSSSSSSSSSFSSQKSEGDNERRDIEGNLSWMRTESEKLESLYMNAARAIHRASSLRLEEATRSRENLTLEFEAASQDFDSKFGSNDSSRGGVSKFWWTDFLGWCVAKDNEGSSDQRQRSVFDAVRRDLIDFYENFPDADKFPTFHSMDGLHMALSLHLQRDDSFRVEGDVPQCIDVVSELSPNPSVGEVLENSSCGICRHDWFQTGPKCRHCKLEDKLNEYHKTLDDAELFCVLRSLLKWIKENSNSSVATVSSGTKRKAPRGDRNDEYLCMLQKRSSKFFAFHSARVKEIEAAKALWKSHFDLLSDIDELNQCKRSIRLLRPDEDVQFIPREEQNAVVKADEIAAKYMDHSAKQTMALGQVRRNKDTLRYLKAQNLERQAERRRKKRQKEQQKQRKNDSTARELEEEEETQTCVLCLVALDGDRAVLSCGHYFHPSCLEILSKRGGNGFVRCPLRCSVPTRKDKILIATSRSNDDGTRSIREVEGSWGTKVDRLVGDILNVCDLGEKSIIFSQWDDMLSIIESALSRNGIKYIRPKGGKQFGNGIKQFRANDCSVLVMNVKNGAEGLTLVEATHIFMVEPLLNCGLDIQAINRVHRIGQSSKTYIHRYLVKDTIEVKIDKLRMERQEHYYTEDDLFKRQKQDKEIICAGGIDGGFSAEELQNILE